MGNQNPKPQLSTKGNDSKQGQQLMFAQLDKKKFLHQLSLNAIAKKLRYEDAGMRQNLVKLTKHLVNWTKNNKDVLIPARVNKIMRIYRFNHRQTNTSINFEVRNMIELKEFKLKDCSNIRSISFYFSYWRGEVNYENMRPFGMNMRASLLHLKKLHLCFYKHFIYRHLSFN